MSPFQALYGYIPTHLDFPSSATTAVSDVAEYMKERNAALQLLKDNLHHAQERMKFFADQKRIEREFQVGDKVYLNIQPYRQASIALRRNLKLAAKFYGPLNILQKIDNVAYKLDLPPEARIHPIFHVSQLKKQLGNSITPSPTLPSLDTNGQILVIPAAVLDTRTIIRRGVYVPQLLIRWTNATNEDSTWEDTKNISHHFPKSILEDKDLLLGEADFGNCSNNFKTIYSAIQIKIKTIDETR
ncbi:uncharacterized protein LOC113306400 [Papaver somniferum]|uniref:uncharacterized protein LOC113306400 n=1 Tax=Papaver somniferum TaxID=3469 RepID=UPI000E6FFF0D|nr:uncharacterized protein LOC113306400 [Papaver somniferum]